MVPGPLADFASEVVVASPGVREELAVSPVLVSDPVRERVSVLRAAIPRQLNEVGSRLMRPRNNTHSTA